MGGDEPSTTRLESLRKLFAEMDINHDNNLSFNEFHQYLSTRSGKDFNSELLGEIFRTIDRDQNSVVTINEFIQGFCKAENIILTSMRQVKDRIAENSENFTNAQRNLVEAKAKNMKGTPENSLYVCIKKAENLKPASVTGNKAPVVLIKVEENETQTTPIPDPVNPEWNQSFTIPVVNGKDDIVVEVWDTERSKKVNLIGEVRIPFSALTSMELSEDFLDLKNKAGKIQGRLLMSLQWIHDLPSYLERLITDYEAALNEDKNELDNLEKYMKELLIPLKENVLPSWITKNDGVKMVEQVVSSTVNDLFVKTVEPYFKWPFFTRISIYFYVLFSILAMFARPGYFDVLFM
jgi:hypothetical protein